MNFTDNSIQSTDYSALLKRLDDIKQENINLRCMLISDPDMNPLINTKSTTYLDRHVDILKKRNEEYPTDRESLLEHLAFVQHQKNVLAKKVKRMQEDNDDVYNTIEIISKEKRELEKERDSIQDNIVLIKSIIEFLLQERDQMKKDLQVKDEKLAEYYQSVSRHGDFIITAQNPLRHTRLSGTVLSKGFYTNSRG